MDDESFVVRWPRRPRPKEIVAALSIAHIRDYFIVAPTDGLPESGPVDWSKPDYQDVEVTWRADVSELERRRIEAQMLPRVSYRERVDSAKRPEEVMDTVHQHIWDVVNTHLGTSACTFPQLIEQLGVMRFGHRPRIADTFCGSGQIPFEGARLGCDAYASDLNPVACMLTWGAFNIVGASNKARARLADAQNEMVAKAEAEITSLAWIFAPREHLTFWDRINCGRAISGS
jgi:putative DNA methylase